MQDKSQMQASQSYQQEQHPQIRYFKNSLLAPNVIPKLCSELTSTEILDDTVEKYLDEMCNHFITTTFESACYLAKHKNTDKVDVSDFASAIYENFGITVSGELLLSGVAPLKIGSWSWPSVIMPSFSKFILLMLL